MGRCQKWRTAGEIGPEMADSVATRWRRGGVVFSVHLAFGVSCQFGSLEAGGGSLPKKEESWGDWPGNGGFLS